MDVSVRRKVVVKVITGSDDTSRPPSPAGSRPPSPANPPMTPISANDSDSPQIFRPRAKINSSALTSRKASSVLSTSSTTKPPRQNHENNPPNSSNGISPARSTPRSPNSTLGPSLHRARTTALRPSLRPQTPDSTPGTPESRYRPIVGLTSSELGIGRPTGHRPRQSSASLHHVNSFSSLQPTSNSSRPPSPNTLGVDASNNSDYEVPLAAPAPIRVKARLSIIKPLLDVNSPLSPTQPNAPSMTRSVSGSLRVRSPSISSSVSAGPTQPNNFYPITTGSPAANPQRYATPRPGVRRQPSPAPKDAPVVAKIDPASIPLPSQSPPTSALSYSSRSSASQSSVSRNADSDSQSSLSTSQNDHTVISGLSLDKVPRNSRLDSNLESDHADTESGRDSGMEERKVRAEAKSNRKIADLEITNRSLLAINATLEKTKHKQAKEIRELRRKLRESRLILPPRTYRAVTSSLEADDTEEDEDEGGEEEEEEDDGDEVYKRLKRMLEGLIQDGRKALEANIPTSSADKPAAKVLSAAEVQQWRDSSSASSDAEDDKEEDDKDISIIIDRSIDEGIDESRAKPKDATIQPIRRSPSPRRSQYEPQLSGRLPPYSRPSRPASPAPPPILITESA